MLNRFPFRSTIQRRRIETFGDGHIKFELSSFRSTIQRRRIETITADIARYGGDTFRSTIQRRRIETSGRQVISECVTLLSEVQSREEGLKLDHHKGLFYPAKPFRSTIQRRRIETIPPGMTTAVLFGLTFRSTIQRRRIETLPQEMESFYTIRFQKYNPEKKDWNWITIKGFSIRPNLSEVQSREEGLKR